MEELKFASVNQALQHLADIMGKTIKIAAVSSKQIPPEEAQFGSDPRMAYERLKEIKSNKEEVHKDVIDFLEDKVARSDTSSFDYALIVLNGRFPKGEKTIQKNPQMSYAYAKALLDKKIPVTQGILNAVAKDRTRAEKLAESFGLTYDAKTGKLETSKEEAKMVASIEFTSTNQAIQHLADIMGKKIVIASSNELVKIFMERDEMTQQEAKEYVEELKERVAEGEDPEEVLYDEGLEPDYVFDLLA